MRRNKIMQDARLSGLMAQRLGLVQIEITYIVRGPPKAEVVQTISLWSGLRFSA